MHITIFYFKQFVYNLLEHIVSETLFIYSNVYSFVCMFVMTKFSTGVTWKNLCKLGMYFPNPCCKSFLVGEDLLNKTLFLYMIWHDYLGWAQNHYNVNNKNISPSFSFSFSFTRSHLPLHFPHRKTTFLFQK